VLFLGGDLMAKQRTIDPDLFTHPLFRRASFIERELWIGLIVNADDEGRVRADAITLAETIFSPLKHGVTEDAISQALAFWQENGWILLYADNCIFLTGWYEHQYINKERRDPSGLPAPPCLIGTWEKADAVFTWYADKEGARKTHYRTALRAFYQLSEAEQEQYMSRTCSEHVLNILAPASKGREGNRTERKGRTTKGKGLAPPIGDAPSDNAVKPLTPQQQIIQEAYAAYPLSGKSTGKGYSGVATAVSQYGIPAVQEWIDWLRKTRRQSRRVPTLGRISASHLERHSVGRGNGRRTGTGMRRRVPLESRRGELGLLTIRNSQSTRPFKRGLERR
jgi:hypothetical protein